MKFLAKIIVTIAVNAFALWAAANYIPGFTITADFKGFLVLALILSALNYFLKPIITLILGPVIVLTLGLGIFLVNALMLFILDKLSTNITIDNVPALIYGTLLVSLINFILHLATK